MTETDIKLPYLVQRVEVRHKPHEAKTGVDRYFLFVYMGSSEFEWGALPSALQDMRSSRPLDGPKEIKAFGHTVWYVGTEEFYNTADAFFCDQLQPRNLRRGRLKERSGLYEAYGLDDWSTSNAIGWWAIDAPAPWCLFKSKECAELWLKGLEAKDE